MSLNIKRTAAILCVSALSISGAAGVANASLDGSISADSLGVGNSGSVDANSGEASLVLDLGSVIPSLNLGSEIEDLNLGSEIENINLGS